MRTRYIFFSILSAAMLAACSSDELVAEMENSSAQNTQGTGAKIEAFQSQGIDDYMQYGEENMDGGQTRANVNLDNMMPQWSVGDEVCVSNGTLVYSYDVTSVTDDGTGCNFRACGDNVAHTGDGTFNAFYPRRAITESEGSGWQGNVVTAQVFSQQCYRENLIEHTNHDGMPAYFGGYYVSKTPVVATSENISFSFRPIVSIIDVDLTALDLEAGDKVSGVYIKSNNGKSLSGHFKYDCQKSEMTTANLGATPYYYSSRSNVVEVNFFKNEVDGAVTYDDLIAINGKKIVRFYVLPTKLTNGVRISVRTKNGHYYTKTSSNPVGTAAAAFTTSDTENMGDVAKPYYKKYNFGTKASATQGAWMACIPNNVFYSMLSIPGAHDAATSSVSGLIVGPLSKCQDNTIQEQLQSGVRALDLRPSPTSNLELRHGSVGTGVTLQQAVDAMHTYLTSNPTESIFAFIHMEKPTGGNVSDAEQATWSDKVYDIVQNAVDGGYALNAMTAATKFSDCQGKIVFVYRDDLTGDAGKRTYHACKVAWNDNIARTVYVRGTNGAEMTDFPVSYQDIYDNSALVEGDNKGLSGYFSQKAGVTNATEKIAMVKRYIDDAAANGEVENLKNHFVLNYASYAGGAIQTPENLAGNIMPSVNAYIQQQHERVGIIFSDFVSRTYGGLNFTAITLANNFKHVFMLRSRVDIYKKRNNIGGTGITGSGLDVAGDENANTSPIFIKGI